MTNHIYQVDKNDVPAYWPHMRAWLNAALEKFGTHMRFPIDFVLMKLMEGEYQSWLVTQDTVPVGAAVTYIEEYPQGKVLFGFLMGGNNLATWGDFLHESMLQYARENNCKWVEVESRRGLGRHYYERLGYKKRYETYTLEVS